MSKRLPWSSVSAMFAARSGGATLFFLLAAVIAIAVVATLLGMFIDFGSQDSAEEPLLTTVTRGTFQHVVAVNGEVESSNSVDIRCEVRTWSTTGPPGPSTTILDVIPEGSLVQPGDWLVTFDSSGLEQQKRAEQIILNTLEADMIEAQALYDTARIDKEELVERGLGRINIDLTQITAAVGSLPPSRTSDASASRTASDRAATSPSSASPFGTFAQQAATPDLDAQPPAQSSSVFAEELPVRAPAPLVDPSYGELKLFIKNEISAADANLRKAQLSFESVKRKVARGLVDRLQLQSERFRLRAAQNGKDLASQKLAVLENYTEKKMLVQLEGNFETAEVRYRSAQRSYEEQQKKVQQLTEQIAKCQVVAPARGQVVYKNVQSSRAGSEFVVEPGAAVRENQAILMLPDPTQMQVKALVAESRINFVRQGMPATVRIDSLGTVQQGSVLKVNRYAESSSWFSEGGGKQYLAWIQLLDLPPDIRVGLTAEVGVIIEERRNALQLPIQTVYKRGEKSFCLVKRGDGWATEEIEISSTNGKHVVLGEESLASLREGDQVAINPSRHRDLFDETRFPVEGSQGNETESPPTPAS